MELRVYVADGFRDEYRESVRRLVAHLGSGIQLDIIDVTKDPARAEADNVVHVPTLIKPGAPERRIVGVFTDVEEVANYLRLRPW